ncbi:uncharacterized protein A4U43_C10F17130 [Asparagus officinalis]|uniref:Uncharacterized protein n=1 Tax=Asparagus officinalis TaxID=4686 RepID=A0A5P1E3D7_ASPOF|nr:uncharacterized protein A4U43_C10F17130 [Asparagus officinalis]
MSSSWKEDARSSTAGSMSANKTSVGSSRNRRSSNGLLAIGVSGVQKETNLVKAGSVNRSILHTIVFNTALGLVRPNDVDCELFEITYVIDKIMQSLFNEILIVSNGVVEISEPNTEAIDKEEQHVEEKATGPSKPIDRIVNDQWIAKQREKTSGKYIGNTKCSQKLRDERKINGF